MHGYARTFSEQAIASIINDSRCEMSDDAFRTAPPTGGLSCFEDLEIFSFPRCNIFNSFDCTDRPI